MQTLSQLEAVGKDRLLRLFWSIYILDMRWSFGTGTPFALEDTDIHPWLPGPEEKTPYLRVMIRYSRIAAKVWKFISAVNNTNKIKKDEMNYLDWQVLRWANAIPVQSQRVWPSCRRPTGPTPPPRAPLLAHQPAAHAHPSPRPAHGLARCAVLGRVRDGR